MGQGSSKGVWPVRGFSSLVALPLAGCIGLALPSPAQADLRADQLFGLGIQLLDQAQRSQARPAPRQPAAQQPAARQPAARQSAPAARTQPEQVRRPRIPRSDAVAEAQRHLNELGYGAGDVDGQAGPQTRRAIAAFQRDHGLAQTGEADAAVLSTLRTRMATAPGAASPAPGPGHTGGGAALGVSGAAALGTGGYAAVAPSGGFQTLPGIDLPGGDYRSGLTDPRLAGTGVDGCAQLCATDAQCQGFTYNTGAGICILKEAVTRQDTYANAVSGIKVGGGNAVPARAAAGAGPAGNPAPTGQDPVAVPGAPPAYADFVHMALMSDTEAYAAEASELGFQYLAAVGTDAQCQAIREAHGADEFTRRDFDESAAAQFRATLSTLGERPRRLEVPIEQTFFLSEYDFARQGFGLPLANSSRTPILGAGVVRLASDTDDRRYCRSISHGVFSNLGAEHGGLPGLDLLPMSPEDARAFRAAGGRAVVLRATLAVEPRDHGRGPLKGTITALSALDPESGRLLHRWDIPAEAGAGAAQDAGQEWSPALLASLIAPAMEPFIEDDRLESASVAYFRTYEREINSGNPPPGSPLPIEEMRGQVPQVIAALNLDRLREAMREQGPALPLTIQIEQRVSPWYDDNVGIQFNGFDSGLMTTAEEDPFAGLELSDRDLQLSEALLPKNLRRDPKQGFKGSVVLHRAPRIAMEFDRIIRLDTIPLAIEEAAARHIVGDSTGERDSVILRWTLDVTGVRATENAAIISVAVKGLSYRWASDNSLLREVAAEDFPTVAALRAEADAARGPVASADNVVTPPDGTRWGAEMTDLLRLRHAPETVDDRTLERMMIARFNYEARVGDDPLWGRFFRNTENGLTPEDRQARLDEFREWSVARAEALPARLTLRLRVHDGPEGKVSPFQNHPQEIYNCRNAREIDPATATENELAESKFCAFLDAARDAPEPLLALPEDCDRDPYCEGLTQARYELKIHDHMREPEMARFDRLPVFDDDARAQDGDAALEVEVEITGGSSEAARPATIWQDALARALPFAETYSLGFGLPRGTEPAAPVMVFDVRTVAARLIDTETGTAAPDLLLGEPAPTADDLLAMPESKVAGHDILGIRLGMSFDEADRLIRAHMEVGKVLTADRSKQLSAATGNIVAYSSGRIYASAAGNELIGILDEPPAAPGTVLGVWRILRLPAGSTDPVALKAVVVGRYGEPKEVEEVSLPFMGKGLAWYWLDAANDRCGEIDFETQADLWQDETGSTAWLPGFMKQPRYPVLAYPSSFGDMNAEPYAPSNFCPAFLGVRLATYDGRNHEETAGDEIVTWLSDNRAYSRLFYESRQSPAEAPEPPAAEGVQIKF